MQKFYIGLDSDSDPLIEMYVVGTEICSWDGDRHVPTILNVAKSFARFDKESSKLQKLITGVQSVNYCGTCRFDGSPFFINCIF